MSKLQVSNRPWGQKLNWNPLRIKIPCKYCEIIWLKWELVLSTVSKDSIWCFSAGLIRRKLTALLFVAKQITFFKNSLNNTKVESSNLSCKSRKVSFFKPDIQIIGESQHQINPFIPKTNNLQILKYYLKYTATKYFWQLS